MIRFYGVCFLVLCVIAGSCGVLALDQEEQKHQIMHKFKREIDKFGRAIGNWFGNNHEKWQNKATMGMEIIITDTQNTTADDLAALADLPELLMPDVDYQHEDYVELYEFFLGFCSMPVIKFEHLQLTDDNLAVLSKITNLKSLVFSSDKITDEGLKHLGNMTALLSLECDIPNATDDGIAALANLTNLRSLSISESDKITDKGLLILAKLTNLRSLIISDCENVTENGLEELSRLMPEVEIRSDK